MDNTGMSDSRNEQPGFARLSRRRVMQSALRAAGSATVLVAVYYLLPLDQSSTSAAVAILPIGLAVLIAMVLWQVRTIIKSQYPGMRAVEALATSLSLFLLLFATTYFVLAKISADSFSQPLTRTDALYFTVTVFSTVGFGDITPMTEVARLVVAGQMVTDVVIIGLGARIIVGAVRIGQRWRSDSRKGEESAGTDSPATGD
jgi:voltage-gated potassium channel